MNKLLNMYLPQRTKQRSLRLTTVRFASWVTIFFLTFSVITFSYMYHSMRANVFDNTLQTMQIYNDNLSRSLQLTRSTMVLHALNNTDVSMMAYDTEPNLSSVDQVKAKKLLDVVLPGLSYTDGIFIYTSTTDHYIVNSRTSYDPCVSYIGKGLRNGSVQDLALTDKWILRKLDGKYYIVNIINLGNTYVGAWVSLHTLTTAFDSYNSEAIFIFTDKKGRPINGVIQEDQLFQPEQTLDQPSLILYDNERYLQVSEQLDFCDYYLVALIPSDMVLHSLQPILIAISVSLLIILLLLITVLKESRRVLTSTLKSLQAASSRVSPKDYAIALPTGEQEYQEIRELNQTINGLITQVTTLQHDKYEESLLKAEFELQYYKSQVAPHFLINCFSTIGSIPDTEEGKVLRKEMIRTLSDHLRYTLSSQKRVVLEDELYYVENYIELTKIRFPDSLIFEVDVDEECMNASVFPLLILMMTENAVKHNLVMGETFTIRVHARLLREGEDSTPLLHITHIDTGSGYPEDLLITLNQLGDSQFNPNKKGYQIGLFNNIKRLRLAYGDLARIHFGNEPGAGARIDIYIPYVPIDLSEEDF